MSKIMAIMAALTVAVCSSRLPAGADDAAVAAAPLVFDGHVSKLEYGDAKHSLFTNGHGQVDVYVKVFDGRLCFGFVIPDETVHPGDDMVVMLDTRNARPETPDKDDLRAYVRRKIENSRMHVGDGKAWIDQYGPWEYRAVSYAAGWEVECRIPISSLGVTDKTTMGFALRIWDNEPQKNFNWPTGSNEAKPNSWGSLVLDAQKILDVVEKP